MGVYIFRSKHDRFIKVGHYAGQNAYSRVAHRGFYSCVCPRTIRERVSMEDLELVAWFPRLTTREERGVKKQWKGHRIGEWFPLECLEPIREFLAGKDTDESHLCDAEKAMMTRRRL